MQMHTTTVQKNLRVFQLVNPNGKALFKNGEHIPAGTQIEVASIHGGLVHFDFDHRSQPALPIKWSGARDFEPRYVLLMEYINDPIRQLISGDEVDIDEIRIIAEEDEDVAIALAVLEQNSQVDELTPRAEEIRLALSKHPYFR